MYLWDLKQAVEDIQLFTHERSFADYEKDGQLQAAVERKFEIIGEALAQMAKHFPDTQDQFTDIGKFIGFRNILIHRYGNVDTTIVWGAIESSVPALRQEIDASILKLGDQTSG
jgi:uncharacterized protein with HEPN domain